MAENKPRNSSGFNSGLRIKKPFENEPPSEANHPELFINNPGFMRPRFNSGLRIKKPFEEEPPSTAFFIHHKNLHRFPACSETLIDKLKKQLLEKNLTNWKVKRSNEMNRCYFFNKVTEVSQWDFPTENLPTVPKVPIVTNPTCGPSGCVIMGGSKRRRTLQKKKRKTIKRRK